ncbi:MAG: efflux RND transporter periplasmic adaptor subunit [Elusimicrobiota bacterium]
MKKRITVLAAVLAVAGAGYWLWPRKAKGRGAEGPATMVTVKRQSIEDTVEATGSVLPLNRVEIKPPIAGRIEKLLFEEGDRVKSGDIVAWMSSNDRAAILDAARAKGSEELQRWQDAYKPTPIISSLTGAVILRDAVVGQTVAASQTIYAVSDTLIVVAQVDESEIGKIKTGMPARVTLDSYPDRPTQGTVVDILYEGKNVANVVTYGVKVKTETVPDFFRSQMTANVAFIVANKESVLVLPSYAIKDLGDGKKEVMVAGPDGKPASKPVKTGVESGELVEITEGLAEGETVRTLQAQYSPQAAPPTSPLAMSGGRGGMRGGASGAGTAPRARRTP